MSFSGVDLDVDAGNVCFNWQTFTEKVVMRVFLRNFL